MNIVQLMKKIERAQAEIVECRQAIRGIMGREKWRCRGCRKKIPLQDYNLCHTVIEIHPRGCCGGDYLIENDPVLHCGCGAYTRILVIAGVSRGVSSADVRMATNNLHYALRKIVGGESRQLGIGWRADRGDVQVISVERAREIAGRVGRCF